MIPFAIASVGAEPGAEVEPHQTSAAASKIWQFQDEYVLGTRLDVVVNAPSGELAALSARIARAEIERLEPIFNHRRHDSEVVALNLSRSARVSPELFAVLQASEAWRAITHGAFDARMGALIALWTAASAPDLHAIARILEDMQASTVGLDTAELQVDLSFGAFLSFDAIAKGYIVDAALNAARRAVPGIEGLAIGIGGDVRCWGSGADARGWVVGIPDTNIPALNAPLVDALVLRNAAVATSGRGPRDDVGHQLRSCTISPFIGQPVRDVSSASVVASHAMDADALATACMVLPTPESLAIVDRLEGTAARITDSRGRVFESSRWPMMRLVANSPEEHIAQSDTRKPKRAQQSNPSWPEEWVLSIDYTAPPRQAKRSADFRSPYMAMWITDEKNKPVRTILMVGRELDWQRDNFVWFGMNRARSKELVDLRSLPTSVSGRYPVYWAGMDDDGRPVPVGKYTLHLETSQERGKHSYRNVTLELGRNGFRQELPKLEGSGGIDIFYGHPSERYNYR
jgi:thiamine biosynthesis lipoprotein